MYFLEKYTRGRPRGIVQSCLQLCTAQQQTGSEKAKTLLQEYFGNETKITAAYMEKVLNWLQVKLLSDIHIYIFKPLKAECISKGMCTNVYDVTLLDECQQFPKNKDRKKSTSCQKKEFADRTKSPQASEQLDMVIRSRILVECEGNMNALQGRVHY